MNVFAHVEDRVAAALEALKQDGVLPAELVVPAVEVFAVVPVFQALLASCR